MTIEKQKQRRMKTHLNAMSFCPQIDSRITTNKLRGVTLKVGVGGDKEDFSTNVVAVVAVVLFFLDLVIKSVNCH